MNDLARYTSCQKQSLALFSQAAGVRGLATCPCYVSISFHIHKMLCLFCIVKVFFNLAYLVDWCEISYRFLNLCLMFTFSVSLVCNQNGC